MLVFDLFQQDVREFWAAVCLNATKSGYIDGCSEQSKMRPLQILLLPTKRSRMQQVT
eukprot:m.126394 g.126394  ORF g.126394 m.126394 type:complete len:57 (+) comp37896_c0_seq2:396-566(+)